MPRAIIQGEVHTSRQDKDALIDRMDLVDAVMRESMEQTFEQAWIPTYLLLFTGMKLFRNTIQRLFYATDQPAFDQAEENGVTVHRMNTSIRAWANTISPIKKSFLFGVTALVTYTSLPEMSIIWLRTLLGIILFVLLYFLYAALITVPERDMLMAENITSVAQEYGYEHVLVSVGDAHVSGIATLLRKKGWEVDTHSSRTLFSRIVRPAFTVVNRVMKTPY